MVIFEATLGVAIVVMSALAILVGRKRGVGFVRLVVALQAQSCLRLLL